MTVDALGAPRRHLASCASTNDEAAAWARAGAPHGAAVIADEQTRGRGRMGRAWSSAAGEGLYLSLVLRPSLPPHRAPALTIAVGLALRDAALALGVRAHLKWPNDLLADEPGAGRRKLAGVLTEMATCGSRIEHVIVGVGLNVGTAAFPDELAATATSLRRLLGHAPPRDDVERTLVAAIDARYRAFLADGAAATVQALREAVDFLGARVSVRAGDERTDGIAERIDDEGALHVRDDAGAVHRLWAGDVEVRAT